MAWNQEKLNELRQRYGENGNDFHNPQFARVADRIFSGGSRKAPYAGIPTFVDADYREVEPDAPDLSGLQAALVGAPMDLGVSNRPGARFGPRALRAIERIGPYNHVLDVAPTHELAVADIGDMPLSTRYRLEQCHDDIRDYTRKIVEAGVIPLTVGGDHSITHPLLEAVSSRHGPVGVIHIDAHCDTGGAFDQTRFHHGGPFRNAVLSGALDPTRAIQIGIRGASEYLWEFSYESGMTVIHAEEVSRLGIPAIIEQARQLVGNGPTYLSFDIDSIDPSFAPGTGTPEVGGLTSREALELLRGLKGLNLIGSDVVEVAPDYDANHNTAQLGAQILFEQLSLMHFSPALPTY